MISHMHIHVYYIVNVVITHTKKKTTHELIRRPALTILEVTSLFLFCSLVFFIVPT